mmetsp:Transcript_61891/g.182822  ORF Transcript_61891/g.182822 Transcript_61891/m.182822 type:complete len:293 (-) Transcript_61891:406-1284(-)
MERRDVQRRCNNEYDEVRMFGAMRNATSRPASSHLDAPHVPQHVVHGDLHGVVPLLRAPRPRVHDPEQILLAIVPALLAFPSAAPVDLHPECHVRPDQYVQPVSPHVLLVSPIPPALHRRLGVAGAAPIGGVIPRVSELERYPGLAEFSILLRVDDVGHFADAGVVVPVEYGLAACLCARCVARAPSPTGGERDFGRYLRADRVEQREVISWRVVHERKVPLFRRIFNACHWCLGLGLVHAHPALTNRTSPRSIPGGGDLSIPSHRTPHSSSTIRMPPRGRPSPSASGDSNP